MRPAALCGLGVSQLLHWLFFRSTKMGIDMIFVVEIFMDTACQLFVLHAFQVGLLRS